MLLKIIFLIFTLPELINGADPFQTYCLELEGMKKEVEVAFAEEITFIPDLIFVQLKANYIYDNIIKGYNSVKYNAILLEKKCPGASFIFPNLFTSSKERQLVELVFSLGEESDLIIDHHEAYVMPEFEETTVTLFGLKGFTKSSIKFSPKLKTFDPWSYYRRIYFRFFRTLQNDQSLFIQLLKLGAQMIFKVGGKGFSKERASDGYQVVISIRKPFANPESTKMFFAKGFVCNCASSFGVNKIFTCPSTQEIQIELVGKNEETLKAVYEKKDGVFRLKDDESTVTLDRLSIESRFPKDDQNSNHIHLYPLEVTRTRCGEDKLQYVDVSKYKGLVLQRKGVFLNSPGNNAKILTLEPATNDQMDECIKESNKINI